ncbi:imidazole glycerol phosphate synthase subunit HisH [Raoultibacter phocaeensis]|uniref:imidazole glycerol phosphate synthase subunit HisH n=1 Tax=Raoultibacter phocaeensis TaxID=2479841 RepID=UPI002102197B|nr:imidazole glycerol phosphate synthase subunit HisH [Raoultibacter phocaeensis]
MTVGQNGPKAETGNVGAASARAPRIAVVDYCKGNLMSVERGLRHVGADGFVTADPAEIARADAIVLPGVGAFADAADTMHALGQAAAIRERIAHGVPFLGICLGLHLMFDEGTEGTDVDNDEAENACGLAVLPGVATSMPRTDAEGAAYKVPHVGWNSIEFDAQASTALLEGIEPGEYFYFTHSYIAPDTPCTVATTVHSVAFPSVVAYRDTAFGVQFHPEKSSDAGAALLRNFAAIARRATGA